MYYLDTCICIEFLRGRLKSGYQFMRQNGPENFALPSVVVAELFYGAEHSSNPSKQLPIVEEFTRAFSNVSFDTAAAREYARIRQELSAQGNLIGDRDMMIAATAIVNQATLITDNLKDFQRIPALHLEAWEEVDL